MLSSSATSCSDWDAAFVSLVRDGDDKLCKSLLIVAKADWAVERSPVFIAPPSAAKSVES